MEDITNTEFYTKREIAEFCDERDLREFQESCKKEYEGKYTEVEMLAFELASQEKDEFYLTEEGLIYVAEYKKRLDKRLDEDKRLQGRGYPLGAWNCFNPIIANIHTFKKRDVGVELIPLINTEEGYRVPDETNIAVRIKNNEYYTSLDKLVTSIINGNDPVSILKALYEVKKLIESRGIHNWPMFLNFLRSEGCFRDHFIYKVSGELEKHGKYVYLDINNEEVVKCFPNTRFEPAFGIKYQSLHSFLFEKWHELFLLSKCPNDNPYYTLLHNPDSFRGDEKTFKYAEEIWKKCSTEKENSNNIADKIAKKCKYCSAVFYSTLARRKFCSVKCGNSSKQKHFREKHKIDGSSDFSIRI